MNPQVNGRQVTGQEVNGWQLADHEAIELVELLRLAVELCATAESFASVALSRLGSVCSDSHVTGSEIVELHRDAARLAAMLSGVVSRTEPTIGTVR